MQRRLHNMGMLDSVSNIQNEIKNPSFLKKKVYIPFIENDFPEGFLITEILSADGKVGKKITLSGNMTPEIPFTTGGGHRIKKDYYAGSNEPVVHVLGSEEDDIVIKGKLKSKKYKTQEYRAVPDIIREEIENIRERGNIVKIQLGEYVRYCLLFKTKFDLNTMPDITYNLTFIVIGRKYPQNARFINDTKELPKKINQDLINKAFEFNTKKSNYPDSVSRSIGETLNALTGAVAGALNTVTGFVDTIISTYNDVQKSVTRAKGLINHAQQKLRAYSDFIGSIDPFNSGQALSGKYTNAKYYNSEIRNSALTIASLETLRKQLTKLTPNAPASRHIVKQGDTLQKISIKFYGTQDSWKKIYDYNKLTSTDLKSGSLLEIPKL